MCVYVCMYTFQQIENENVLTEILRTLRELHH